MRLLLSRHGQTVWNTERRTQGRTDIELDEIGRMQAQCLARRLADEKIDCIYSSPLCRAMETARAVAATTGAPIIADERIIERDFGAFEGKSLEELMVSFKKELKIWEQSPYEHMVEGAEPMPVLRERCASFLEDLFAKNEKDNVLVISHSVPLRMMLALLIDLPPNRIHSFYLENCAYTRVFCDKQRSVIVALNDKSHLKDML